MVIFILMYVFWFAWVANSLFSGTIEGIEYFSTLSESFFSMFVCLTTSNYPDIMLESYDRSRLFALFFIIYLIIGLFIFLNLLLAIFYANYQERVEASIDNFFKLRNDYLIRLFRKYATDGKVDKKGVRMILCELNCILAGKADNDKDALDDLDL